MSETVASTSVIRAAVIGDRITISDAAAAFGVTEHAIYFAIKTRRIPFVRIFGRRYLRPADLGAALVAPRGRGRPRKSIP